MKRKTLVFVLKWMVICMTLYYVLPSSHAQIDQTQAKSFLVICLLWYINKANSLSFLKSNRHINKLNNSDGEKVCGLFLYNNNGRHEMKWRMKPILFKMVTLFRLVFKIVWVINCIIAYNHKPRRIATAIKLDKKKCRINPERIPLNWSNTKQMKLKWMNIFLSVSLFRLLVRS